MISPTTIVFMIIQGILAIGIPIFFLIYFIRKHRISWKPVLIGLLVFIVFSQILEAGLHQYVLHGNAQTKEWMSNPFIYAIYGSLAAGIFEEVGRYIGFRYLLHNYRDWKDGIAYGIGHGGIEALLIGGLSAISVLITAFMINTGGMEQVLQETGGSAAESLQAGKDQLINTPSYVFLLGGLERLFTFIIHLGLSLLVLYGIRNKRNIFLLYAILAHAVLDFLPALTQKLSINPFVVEGYVLIIAILALLFIVKSRGMFTGGKPESHS